MQNLNDLYFFTQVVEYGGFAPAGRELGIPKSKLSRRIALLEERLGVRLIQRSSRRFHVTDIGRVYLRHCKAMLVEAEAAQQAIDAIHSEPCGLIRMSCPTTLLHVHVSPMLNRFMTRYPQVQLQLDATNRRVDVLGEGLDLAIRVRPPPLEDSDLVLRVLSARGQCLVASPELLRAHAPVHSPDDLTALPSLARGRPEETHRWDLQGPDEAQASIRHTPRLITTDMLSLRSAALAGLGIVQLPHLMVHEQLQNGALQQVLPTWEPRAEIIHAVFPSRRGMLPAVRALIDHLASGYAALEDS